MWGSEVQVLLGPQELPRTRQRTGAFHKETTVKKLILIALAAAGAVLVKKQLDKSGTERAQWAEATDTVPPAQQG
jgi:hypothetical protein